MKTEKPILKSRVSLNYYYGTKHHNHILSGKEKINTTSFRMSNLTQRMAENRIENCINNCEISEYYSCKF